MSLLLDHPHRAAAARRADDHVPRGGVASLALGALGFVFGSVDASPLYALDQIVRVAPGDALGAVSLAVWSLTLVVAIQYPLLVLRAQNDGEGGLSHLPLLATIVVFIALFVTGGFLYNNFMSTLVLGDILADNAFIITAAIGTTFVILSGGIDLSIGSMIGFVGVVIANLDVVGWHPLVSAAMMLGFGLAFGALQGLVIDFCEIQPFIVTLAGLFLLRGSCFMINLDSTPIQHPFVAAYAAASIPLPGGGFLASSAIVMLISLVAAIALAHFTRFGANVYAMGGDRASAALMGVPMRRTTVAIYALGGSTVRSAA